MSFESERNGGRGMKGRHSQAEKRRSHRPRQKRKSTARKVVGGVIGSIGEILLVVAVVIALYVVWQLWWTGVVSQQTPGAGRPGLYLFLDLGQTSRLL